MIDIRFIIESVRRHVALVAVALVAGILFGVSWSYVFDGDRNSEPSFTAEATLYVSGFEQADSGDFNYQLNESWLSSDVRRVVLSDSVSGTVRRQLGEDVVITSPSWVDEKTNYAISSHFVFVQANAKDRSLALEAVGLAVEKAVPLIRESLNASEVYLYEGPTIVSASGRAGDYGVDPLTVAGEDQLDTGVNWKIAVLLGGLAFIAACLIAVLVDFVEKKVRCPRDVERLFGIPVLGEVPGGLAQDEAAYLKSSALIDLVCKRNKARKVFVAELGDSGLIGSASSALKSTLKYADVVGYASIASPKEGLGEVVDADCLLLFVCKMEAGSKCIDSAAEYLNLMGLPVIGAVYVD